MFSFLKKLFIKEKAAKRWDELTLVSNPIEINYIKIEMSKVPHDDELYEPSELSKEFRQLLDNDQAPSIDERSLNDIYDTNVKLQTCSCKDWLMSRQKYDLGDPRRLCKHLIHKLNLYNLPDDLKIFHGSLKFYQKRKLGFDRKVYTIFKIPGAKEAVVYKKGWCDVTDADGNRYAMVLHSYKDENIFWYRGDMPEDHEIIEEFFQDDSFRLPAALHSSEIKQISNYLDAVGFDESFDYDLIINDSTPSARLYGLVTSLGEVIGYALVSNTHIGLEFSSELSDIYFARSKELVREEVYKSKKRYIDKVQFQLSLKYDYDTAKNLLPSSHAKFGLGTFYKLLRAKTYLIKEGNTHIAIGDGLEYAMNHNQQVLWNKHKFKTLIETLNNDYDILKRQGVTATKEV